MTRQAIVRKPEERPASVFEFDFLPGSGGNIVCRMATLALLRAVFPFQHKSGTRAVIEVRALQSSDSEVLAVMLHMATGAVGLPD